MGMRADARLAAAESAQDPLSRPFLYEMVRKGGNSHIDSEHNQDDEV
jgi:hypothetical protein